MDYLALAKLKRYCAYQERCQQEVRYKLIRLKVYGDDLEEIIAELISTGFLSESRYASSFARGKFRNNGWGRVKIRLHLKSKGISDIDASAAMNEIDEQEYYEKLLSLLQRKAMTFRSTNQWQVRQKLHRYGMQRGFEPRLIEQVICDIDIENRLEGDGSESNNPTHFPF